MSGDANPPTTRVRTFPPPPPGFDALTATTTELARHGLPPRPDPRTQPEFAAFWERRARRYRGFQHLEPVLRPANVPTEPAPASFRLSSLFSSGYELTSPGAPISMFSGTWTVPNLHFSPSPIPPNDFHTFFGLGFLDVHVEMTVDAAQNVTALIRIHTGWEVAIPVRPGDVMSAILCLQNDSASTAFYGLANETTLQTIHYNIETGFPPAVTINAGISRGTLLPNNLPDPLARFGVVYFDELLAFATDGTKLLTDGISTSMIEDGSTLAEPEKLNDFAFKVVYKGD